MFARIAKPSVRMVRKESGTVPADVKVAVAVTTFRRPALLAPLIEEILMQIASVGDAYACRVVIVDNDPDESARVVAAGHGVDYTPESVPGIAAARQRVLDTTASDDVVVMLDDDVLPEAEWLAAILATWERFKPTVVMGYVRWVWPPLDEPVIRKVRDGGFMRRPELPTGTRQEWLATGNVLIDLHAVRRLGLAFDVSLGLSGGEDTLFGADVIRRGGTIVACRESSAMSVIPPERATSDFARRRAIGQGTSISFLRLRSEHGIRRSALRAAALAGGILRLCVFSIARAGAHLLGDDAREGKYLRKQWFALGRIRGAAGHVSDEYSRPQRN
jgi:hypothetical protein